MLRQVDVRLRRLRLRRHSLRTGHRPPPLQSHQSTRVETRFRGKRVSHAAATTSRVRVVPCFGFYRMALLTLSGVQRLLRLSQLRTDYNPVAYSSARPTRDAFIQSLTTVATRSFCNRPKDKFLHCWSGIIRFTQPRAIRGNFFVSAV